MWTLIASIAKGFLERHPERQALYQQQTMELKMKQHELKLKREKRLYDADTESVKQMQFTWKDEYILLLHSIPLILCFFPSMAVHVSAGFEALDKAPLWFKVAYVGIVISTYGLRFMKDKFFNTNGGLKQ